MRARGRTWVVTEVDSYPSCRVVALAEPGAPGSHRRLVMPFDDVEVEREVQTTRRVGARAWQRACRQLAASDTSATSLRTASSAQIEPLPYQLEPALALLAGRGSRLLIADDVGLGKTVQAMLAIAELRARGLAARVLVVCPAGLRDQWTDEWRTRFGLPFVSIDHAAQRRIRVSLPYGVNPWRTEPLVVASVDYVKRPDVLPSVLSAGWDAVVVDEAHGACGLSERHAAVSQLCGRAPWVVLLSATPHNGDDAAFAALYNLGRHRSAHDEESLIVFRRSRLEAGRDAGRRVHSLRVSPTDAERRMHAALADLTQAVRRESPDMDRHAWLVLSLLHKRALSSAFALAASVERRLQLLGAIASPSAMQLALPLDDETGDLDAADAAPMWSQPVLHDHSRERRLLERLLDAARQAEGREAKLHRLHRLLRATREPLIVFTEYRDTLMHLRSQVAPDAAVVHGGLNRDQRREALEAFGRGRLLLATDAAGEGLNLQRHCRTVVNLELPWNPMRLEQRIGRVDRIGQPGRVHVVHLVAAHTAEVRLLDRLSARVSHAHARIGAPDPFSGRPAWTEDASARLVVLNLAPPATPASSEAPRTLVPHTRLEPEGVAEAGRLAMVRTWNVAETHAGSASVTPAPATTTLVTSTRRARARRTLLGATVACYRTTVANAAGQAIATRVSGLSCAPGVLSGSLSQRVDRLRALAAVIARTHDGWAAQAHACHARLVRVYANRLAEVRTRLALRSGEQQPGLFYRRIDLADERFADEYRQVQADIDERLARCEVMAQPGDVATTPALVLEPRGCAR